jgi:hypothetical protein
MEAFSEVGLGPAGFFTLSIQMLELLPYFPLTDIPSNHKAMFFGSSYRYSEFSYIFSSSLEKNTQKTTKRIEMVNQGVLLIFVYHCSQLHTPGRAELLSPKPSHLKLIM